MNDSNYYWQMQYWTKDGNQFVEWFHGTRREADLHISMQEQKHGWRNDELWKYELDDPRVLTGKRGLIVQTRDFRDFTQDLYND